MPRTLLFLLAFALPGTSAYSQLKTAAIFSNHMVLQQQTEVPIWGTAQSGTAINIRCSWLPQPVSCQANAKGQWSAKVATPSGSLQPQRIEIAGSAEKIVLEDVLIGEVWLCSGQSNMEYRVEESGYSPAQTRAAQFPHIRHFKVNHAVSLVPVDTLERNSSWQPCNDETVQQFTAVGYFFARELAEQNSLYNIPIGLVNSSWGGSQVESWISGVGMAQSELFKDYMAKFPQTWAEADARSLAKVKTYILGTDQRDPSAAEEAAYINPNIDISGWKSFSPTYAWDWQQVWAFRGSACMAIDVPLSSWEAAAPATLSLGYGSGPAEIFINGQQLWSGEILGKDKILIPAQALKPGSNRILVRQKLGAATGWVEMGMRGDAGDFWLEVASGRISLAGNWRGMPLFSEPFYFVHSSNNLGTAIYNAMIEPMVHFPIKGVIWYQGESNAGRAKEYRQSFPLLINDWRRAWGYDFPFLFVQLANWEAGNGNSKTGSEWAELREAQAMTLDLPHTGMAVTIDIGDSKDIHPKNKHDVGSRLAYEARRVAYGEDLPPGSPTKPEIYFGESRVQVYFPTEKAPPQVHNKYGYVHGFELAGADGVFHYAKAEVSAYSVWVESKLVPQPVALRYAWADDPNDVNLYTANGFPIAPFRSDNWKEKTDGKRFE